MHDPAVELLGYGHAPYRAPHWSVAPPGLYQSFAVNLGAHTRIRAGVVRPYLCFMNE